MTLTAGAATERPAGGDLARAARAGFVGLLGSGAAAVAGLLLNVVVGHAFGPVGSGLFFVVVALLTVVGTVTKLGADTGLVWALSRAAALGRRTEVGRVLRIALVPPIVVSAVAAVALLVLAGPLAELVGAGDPAEVARLLRLSAPFVLVAAPVAVLAAGLRGMGSVVQYTSVQNLVVPGLRPFAVAVAAGVGSGLAGAVVAWNAPLVIGVAVAAVLVVRRSRQLSHTHPGDEPARSHRVLTAEFWRFSGARSVAAVMEVVVVWADVLIVAALASPRDAGIYAAASRFITTGTLAEAALRVALGPQLSRLLALGLLVEASRLRATATLWLVLLSWPLYLCLALYSPQVLAVFGPGFSEGAGALSLLAVAMLVVMAAGNSQTVLLMSGRSLWQMVDKTVVVVLNIGLNLWLVPSMGMMGAAVAWSTTVVVDALVVLAQVRWGIGLKTPAGVLAPAVAVSLVAFVPLGLLARWWAPGNPAWAAAAVSASCAAFAALVWRCRRRLELGALAQAVRRPAGAGAGGGSREGASPVR